jgi:hypothetical protein
MPLDIDTQLVVLVDQIRKADATNTVLKDKALEWLRTYGDDASAAGRAAACEALHKKFGVSFNEMAQPTKKAESNNFCGLIHPVFPKTGWLGLYLDYTRRHESPDLFHFWVGVSVLCGAVRRGVYFEQGYYRVYPNFYVILVAPPGVCKKSTATNIGVEVLQQLPDVNIIREKITPEGLIANLHENIKLQQKVGSLILSPSATGFIHAPELAVFLGRESYNEGIIALLTSLFDCHNKWEYTTRGSGKLALHNLHLVMLGATTPDLMANVIPNSAFGGGFLSRVMFVVREKTNRCEPFPVVRDALTRERLAAQLLEIASLSGQVVQNKEALEWCVEWYGKNHQKMQEEMSLSGYYERKQDHLIKLATALLISDGKELVITPEVYQKALDILDFTEETMSFAFARTQTTLVGRDHERILSQIEKAGGKIRHSDLLKKNYSYLSADAFRKAMGTLREAGMVEEHTQGKAHEYVLLKRR